MFSTETIDFNGASRTHRAESPRQSWFVSRFATWAARAVSISAAYILKKAMANISDWILNHQSMC